MRSPSSLFPLIILICVVILVFQRMSYGEVHAPDARLRRVWKETEKVTEQLELIKEYLKGDLNYTRYPAAALEWAIKGLDLATSEEEVELIAFFYHQLALIYFYLGDYENAMEFNLKDLEWSERRKDTIAMVMALDNIGNIPFATGNFSKALEYYQKSLALAEMIYCDHTYYLYTSVGKAFLAMNDYEQAVLFYGKSLKMALDEDHPTGIAMSYHNLSKLHWQKKDEVSARNYAFKSLELYQDLENHYAMAQLNILLAGISIENGDLDQAIEFADDALLNADQRGFSELKVEALDVLSIAYERSGDYRRALEYRSAYAHQKDVLLSHEKLQQIKRLEINFEVRQKENELALLAARSETKELEIQKKTYLNYWLISILIFAILAGVLLLKQYRSRMREKHILLERKLLRSQMNPHFIFNSLIAIQSFLFESKNEEAASFLSKYAELMRMILENSRQEYVSLEKEIKTLRYYLELQKLRFENRIDIHIHVDHSIPLMNTLVPPMLAQPFLENSLEHGFVEPDPKGRIDISITQVEDHIVLDITDNGIGRDRALKMAGKSNRKYRSLATRITEERLVALNRQRKEKIALAIQDLKNEHGKPLGTKVRITIPIQYGGMNKAI